MKRLQITLAIILSIMVIRLLMINASIHPYDILPTFAAKTIKKENPYFIHVELDTYTMYVFKDGEVIHTYPVSGGKPSTPSPLGTWTIVSKANWGEGFGGTWMGFNVPWGKYGIHGTDEPWSIGKPLSKGCIRMYNKDAKELKGYIPHGTKINIVKGPFGLFGDGFRTLRNGAIGSDVYAVQLRLKQLGYYHGTPDGKFGNGLGDAIKRFRKDKNLYVVPILTREVYEAMGFYEFE